MRPRYLIYKDIFDELGDPEGVAPILGVEVGTARKYEDKPEKSGLDMPVRNVQKLLLKAGGLVHQVKLQELLDELLRDHFAAPARRHLIRKDNLDMAVALLHNEAQQKNYPEFCEKGHPLVWVTRNRKLHPFCIGCQGG